MHMYYVDTGKRFNFVVIMMNIHILLVSFLLVGVYVIVRVRVCGHACAHPGQ